MSYVRSHWRGRQSFAQAFWINFVVISLALYSLLAVLSLQNHIPFVLFLAAIVTGIAIFVWQTVGLIRSGEAHVAAHGSLTPVWGSYVAVLIVLFVFGTQWLGIYQRTIPHPVEELFTTRMDRLHASTYELRQSEDGTTLTLDGEIALGATRIIGQLLADKPAIHRLVLNSVGGNIYEARGVARLVVEHGLDTHIDGTCSSACTIVFVSGMRRTMAEDARLGFHQYRLDSTAQIPNVDIDAEQQRDRSFFEMRHVSADFLEKMFDRPHSEIWYPDRQELVSAHIITE